MAEPERIWVVDDDRAVRFVLATALRDAGFEVTAFAAAAEALDTLQRDIQARRGAPALVVTDVRMPGDSGLQLLEKLKAAKPDLPVIVMSAHTDVASTAGAFRGGAHEFLSKPFDLDEAVALVRRALPQRDARGPRDAQLPVDAGDADAATLVGDAPAMRALFRAIGRLAQAPLSVLITGETGTGKELVARALHRESPRASRPFVALNTAAIPAELLESELFGHEAGAFTGAHKRHIGRFEQADGGTLFLDEIGDMPKHLQARLLRVLQERKVSPLGAGKEVEVDVAIVSATHKNLKDMIARGDFREDLYYRLNGLVVRLPALRERTDFDLVVQKIVKSLCENGQHISISPKVMDIFKRYHWPGNFRQLHNLLRTAVVMVGCEGAIEMGHLPDDFLEELEHGLPHPVAQRLSIAMQTSDAEMPEMPSAPPMPEPAVDSQKLQDVALSAMAQMLRLHKGNVSAAAKALGVSRNTIYRKKGMLPPDLLG